MRVIAIVLASAAFAAASPATAQSFFNDWESTDFGDDAGFTIVPTYEGWSFDGGAGSGIEVQYNNVAGLAFSGENLVEIDSDGNYSMSRGIGTAGSYTFSFYYSDRPNVGANSNGLEVLLNGNSILTVAGGDGGPLTDWTQYSVSFFAPTNSTITFSALGSSDSLGGYIDDVALAAVPEPATWGLMIAGIGAIGGAARRRKTFAHA